MIKHQFHLNRKKKTDYKFTFLLRTHIPFDQITIFVISLYIYMYDMLIFYRQSPFLFLFFFYPKPLPNTFNIFYDYLFFMKYLRQLFSITITATITLIHTHTHTFTPETHVKPYISPPSLYINLFQSFSFFFFCLLL